MSETAWWLLIGWILLSNGASLTQHERWFFRVLGGMNMVAGAVALGIGFGRWR